MRITSEAAFELPLFGVHPVPKDDLTLAAVNTYRACPLRYYFRHVAQLAEGRISSSLLFGAGIHRALRHYFERRASGEPVARLEELLTHYRLAWNQHGQVPIDYGADNRASLDLLAARLLSAFLRDPLAQQPGRIVAIGKEVRGVIDPGLPPLSGWIDLVVDVGDERVLQQWKTSRIRWTQEQVDEATVDLALHSEAFHERKAEKPIRLELVVFTKTKDLAIEHFSRPLSSLVVVRGKRIVERVWRAIGAGLFYPAPSPINCGNCPFRDPCRSWPG